MTWAAVRDAAAISYYGLLILALALAGAYLIVTPLRAAWRFLKRVRVRVRTDMARFPTFPTHDDVRCCICDGPTANTQDAGFADGQGRYRRSCVAGHSWTYYDLTDEARREAGDVHR